MPRLPTLALIALVASAALASSTAFAKPADNDARKQPVEILITALTDLRFGSLVLTSASGQVTVPVSGLPTYSNVVGTGGAIGPARIELRGEPNKTVEVVILSPTTGKYGTVGKGELEKLVLIPDSSLGSKKLPGVFQIKLDKSGFNALTIGGSLRLSGDDAAGPLSIPIPISTSYSNG